MGFGNDVRLNIVYEDYTNCDNFVDCLDVNTSTIRRFTPSVFADLLPNKSTKSVSKVDKLQHYIIPTGVNHHPRDWTGYTTDRKSILYHLSPKFLKDLQKGKALLCIDQSLEGYQTGWVWEYFHKDCADFNVSPRAVVYVTGNSLAPAQYCTWCELNNIKDRMKVIAYEHFEFDVQEMAQERKKQPNWDKIVKYKKTHNIKTYSCLNKRLRGHRVLFFTELYKHGLLDCGLVSMNDYNQQYVCIDGYVVPSTILGEARQVLPLRIYEEDNTTHADNFYIRRILDKVYLDSWVGVVTEPQFADEERSVFCSEKIFKSIACMHPFIILGGKGSLNRLRELGYKTFDGFIDESYDQLDSLKRIDAIIQSIKKIDSIENKQQWFEGMKDILLHNYNLLMTKTTASAFAEMEQYYKEYFNV